MKNKKLTVELEIPKEDYYQLCKDAENELRTVENEIVYRVKTSVNELRSKYESLQTQS
tara:strand:- start:500 stop:673 length:174 start_codon:yes stop_codon:yes gene_type:complete